MYPPRTLSLGSCFLWSGGHVGGQKVQHLGQPQVVAGFDDHQEVGNVDIEGIAGLKGG